MYGILLVIHVVIAIMLIGLILIQHGKGAQTGAAFGSGASQTVFGSQGSGGFLSRATGILAALFFLLNLLLVFLVNKTSHHGILSDVPTVVKEEAQKGSTQVSPTQRESSPTVAPSGTDVPETE